MTTKYSNVELVEMVRLYAVSGDNLYKARFMFAELFPKSTMPSQRVMMAATQNLREYRQFDVPKHAQGRGNVGLTLSVHDKILDHFEREPLASKRDVARNFDINEGTVRKILRRELQNSLSNQPPPQTEGLKTEDEDADDEPGTSQCETEDPDIENECKVFCPKCNTDVLHTAGGIQEDLAKALVGNVYRYLEKEYEELKTLYGSVDLTPLSKISQRTAKATGVSEATVLQVLKEEEEQRTVCQPAEELPKRATRKRTRKTKSSKEDNSEQIADVEKFSSKEDNSKETADADQQTRPQNQDEEIETLVVKVEPSEYFTQQSSQGSQNIIIETGHHQDQLNTRHTINIIVNNNKKERQKRYREQNRDKLKQREAERRKRIQYSQSTAGPSTSSNTNRIELNNEEIITAQSSFSLEETQLLSIQRNEQGNELNALQKKRERQQRYREQNRDKLKQREAERRWRLQNAEMITEYTSPNIDFTEINNDPIIDEISTDSRSEAGLEMQHLVVEVSQQNVRGQSSGNTTEIPNNYSQFRYHKSAHEYFNDNFGNNEFEDLKKSSASGIIKNEETETMITPANVKLEPGGEASGSQIDPIAVAVKTEPCDDGGKRTNETLAPDVPAINEGRGRKRQRKDDDTTQHTQGLTTARASSSVPTRDVDENSLLAEGAIKTEEIEIHEEGFS